MNHAQRIIKLAADSKPESADDITDKYVRSFKRHAYVGGATALGAPIAGALIGAIRAAKKDPNTGKRNWRKILGRGALGGLAGVGAGAVVNTGVAANLIRKNLQAQKKLDKIEGGGNISERFVNRVTEE